MISQPRGPRHAAGLNVPRGREHNGCIDPSFSAPRSGAIRLTSNKEARERYLAFAMSPQAEWSGNFRDLAASVTRMPTFSRKGRINGDCVDAEIMRLKRLWSADARADDGLASALSPETLATLGALDRVQLPHVVATCRSSRTLSEAVRTLFAASRARRTSSNDADRLRKYLQCFGLEWSSVAGQR